MAIPFSKPAYTRRRCAPVQTSANTNQIEFEDLNPSSRNFLATLVDLHDLLESLAEDSEQRQQPLEAPVAEVHHDALPPTNISQTKSPKAQSKDGHHELKDVLSLPDEMEDGLCDAHETCVVEEVPALPDLIPAQERAVMANRAGLPDILLDISALAPSCELVSKEALSAPQISVNTKQMPDLVNDALASGVSVDITLPPSSPACQSDETNNERFVISQKKSSSDENCQRNFAPQSRRGTKTASRNKKMRQKEASVPEARRHGQTDHEVSRWQREGRKLRELADHSCFDSGHNGYVQLLRETVDRPLPGGENFRVEVQGLTLPRMFFREISMTSVSYVSKFAFGLFVRHVFNNLYY